MSDTTAPQRGPLALPELGAFVAHADTLAAHSHAQRNDFLMSRWLPYPLPPQADAGQPDPFGAAHQAWVVEQWRQVSGRADYALDLEFDNGISASPEQLTRLYPFISGDTDFTANYMLGVYFALKLLADAPNRQLVEYGVGWGNTCCAFMQAGFDVLGVDIDPKWLGLLELRARQLGVGERLRTHVGEFGALPPEPARFGGALFFECFHHALNHDAALASLAARMEDGGIVLFAAEAIYRDFPLDWGVRQDGHSVWAIRRFGWMELGFSEDYFIHLCRRHNLELTRHVCEAAGPFGVIYKAVVRSDGVALGKSLLTRGETGLHETESDPTIHTRFSTGDCTLEVPCGGVRVGIELRNWLNRPLRCSLAYEGRVLWEAEVQAGQQQLVTLPNPRAGYFRRLHLRSDAHRPLDLGINDDPRRLGIAVGRIRIQGA